MSPWPKTTSDEANIVFDVPQAGQPMWLLQCTYIFMTTYFTFLNTEAFVEAPSIPSPADSGESTLLLTGCRLHAKAS